MDIKKHLNDYWESANKLSNWLLRTGLPNIQALLTNTNGRKATNVYPPPKDIVKT